MFKFYHNFKKWLVEVAKEKEKRKRKSADAVK